MTMHKLEGQRKAYEQITQKLAQIVKLQEECVEIARKYNVEFYYPAPKDSYGMGGAFYPNRKDTGGWQSSTQSCYE